MNKLELFRFALDLTEKALCRHLGAKTISEDMGVKIVRCVDCGEILEHEAA